MKILSIFSFIKHLSLILILFCGIDQLVGQNKVEVIGQIKITGGSPGENKVLTSDAVGLATWEIPEGDNTEVAFIFNTLTQVVMIEDPVIFDSNGFITSGFVHVQGTGLITIINTGIYKATFSVSGTEPNQFALFLNDSPIFGSTYGSGAGTQQNNGQVVFSAAAGDVVSLRNHSSFSSVGLFSFTGGTQSNVNASIILEKL
ncbi:MAG: hypothetical protein H7X99_04385 [Saprospiraceae bacterium]|nr:hypothetical protein [Saprospiraceae bacterium]